MPIKENSANQPIIISPLVIFMLGAVLLRSSKPVRKIRRRLLKRSGSNYLAGRGLRRVICALLILSLNWASLSAIGSTAAAFSDTKTSATITLDTGTLDLGLSWNQTGFAPNKIAPDVPAALNVKLEDLGDIAMQYRITAQKITGGANVCENLMIDAKLEDQPVYSNKLLGLNLGPLAFATTSDETATSTAVWQFGVVFPGLAKNLLGTDRSCQFKIMFDGWQFDLPNQSQGFSSHKEIVLNLLVGGENSPIDVIYPNGGQHWFVVDPRCLNNDTCKNWCATRNSDPMNNDCQYPIQWTAHNPNGPDTDLRIDLYYSNDSGQHWLLPFATGLPNTGRYLWMLPYDMAYVTHTARIKVVAYDKNNPTVRWEGQSANDFCPPMLSIEDLMNQIDGLENAEQTVGGGGGEPRARSEASVDPAEITPMPVEEITGALDEIRDATTSAETALGGVAQDAAPTPEIVPYAAPSDSDAAPTLDTITGPPAVIPVPSKDKNATSTDTLVS